MTLPLAHIPGTVSIPLNASFTNWAGWFVPFTKDFYVIVDDRTPNAIDTVVRDLAMIGLDRISDTSTVPLSISGPGPAGGRDRFRRLRWGIYGSRSRARRDARRRAQRERMERRTHRRRASTFRSVIWVTSRGRDPEDQAHRCAMRGGRALDDWRERVALERSRAGDST
jgi:hypothetical protein